MVRSMHQLFLFFNNFLSYKRKDHYSEEFLPRTTEEFSSLWYFPKSCVAMVMLTAGLSAPITAQYVALTPAINQSG